MKLAKEFVDFVNYVSRIQHKPVTVELTDKWMKVYTGNEIYSFIALNNDYTKSLGNIRRGNVYRPISANLPAKTARGNVFDGRFHECATKYGIVYLR